jgi:DNA repair protein RadC
VSDASPLQEAPRYHAPALRLMLVREAPGAYRRRLSISSSDEAAAAVRDVLGSLAQERFVILLLDAKCRLLSIANVSEGSITSVPVDPRLVFSAALLGGAVQILAAHNHPSGNPEPSEADRHLTRKLAEAGKLLGIRLLDHIVIAGAEHVSLSDTDPGLFR